MSLRHWVVDRGAKALNLVHGVALKISGNRLVTHPYGMPTVELHTVGRRSGKPRSNLLTSPIHDEHSMVLVASKGGDDRHPDWYHNLVAHPDAELVVDGAPRPIRARVADPEEKAELWPHIVAAHEGYADYQKRTNRDIPVVICEFR